ncbi:EF-hand domain-containing protein [Xanthomonas sp. Kuri4-3]
MKTRNRKSLIAATAALAAALALPAMAQTAQQDPAAAAAAQSGSSATSAQSGGGQTWASVDTDSDGAISKQEAQVNAGLSQIFDQADGDGNGKLTPDEYKAFVAKQQSGANSASPQQQN